MAHKELVISWLNDAYSMENALVQVLENHAKDAEGHPELQSRLQQHIETTRTHADRVKERIEALGGSTSSVKTGMASIFGTVQGMSTGAAKDELVKNALADHAAEQFEVASYTALMAAAEELGDLETLEVCRQNLREDADMGEWLLQHIPMVTLEVYRREAGSH